MSTELSCPHCGAQLSRWANPQLSNWSGDFQYVCFKDECPYFVRGWVWMKEHYNVTASYRYSIDPTTGACGPLPVWSEDALRNNILSEPGEEDRHAG